MSTPEGGSECPPGILTEEEFVSSLVYSTLEKVVNEAVAKSKAIWRARKEKEEGLNKCDDAMSPVLLAEHKELDSGAESDLDEFANNLVESTLENVMNEEVAASEEIVNVIVEDVLDNVVRELSSQPKLTVGHKGLVPKKKTSKKGRVTKFFSRLTRRQKKQPLSFDPQIDPLSDDKTPSVSKETVVTEVDTMGHQSETEAPKIDTVALKADTVVPAVDTVVSEVDTVASEADIDNTDDADTAKKTKKSLPVRLGRFFRRLCTCRKSKAVD